MPSVKNMMYYAMHPMQLRAMIQWKLFRDPIHERQPEFETPTLRRCFDFLDLTSRSFSAVIQELQPEMRVPVSLFYLILRGLDTIEDDMSLSIEIKEPLLRTFYEKLEVEGWNFDGNGPNEKDRQLLVEFQVVIEEFMKLKPVYKDVIKDITKQMGNGMADTAINPDTSLQGLKTIVEYDRYCWYVAGLVGEGLTRLFVPAGFANPALMQRPNLYMSMGLFLQKTNIIRDYAEDLIDKRSFYPKEIWSKHVDNYTDLAKPEYLEAALNCNSELVLNALDHADECLFYLAGLRDQSVFNFCAIPQTMAIATLALIFRNPDMYHKNVKIPKGEACELMMAVGNLRSVCGIFRKYLRIIHKKNTPRDPNFMRISVACGKVEQFIETIFPTQDMNAIALKREADDAKMRANALVDKDADSIDAFFLVSTVIATAVVMSLIMLGSAWYAGARYDLIWEDIKTQGAGLGPIIKTMFGSGDSNTSVSDPLLSSSVVHGDL